MYMEDSNEMRTEKRRWLHRDPEGQFLNGLQLALITSTVCFFVLDRVPSAYSLVIVYLAALAVMPVLRMHVLGFLASVILPIGSARYLADFAPNVRVMPTIAVALICAGLCTIAVGPRLGYPRKVRRQ